MEVFVTGATGFIGSAIATELISAGHRVTGLARSDASAQKLTAAGAQVLRGDIEDLECLRRGVSAADGAIHTAFYHQIGHMNLGTRLRVMLGGTPSGIVQRFLSAAIGMDRRALETLGRSLAGPDRPLVAAFATMAMKPGRLTTEDDANDPKAVGAPRGASEDTMRALASLGIRTSIIRLPPVVHGAAITPSLRGSSGVPGKRESRPTSVTATTDGPRCTGSMLRVRSGWHSGRDLREPRITALPRRACRSGRLLS
jgi:nucleoside-diphosphate-sugar epimerase